MEKSSFFDAELLGFDEAGNPLYDNEFNSADFAKYFSSFIGNGVFPNPASNCQVVSVDNNMQITIKSGLAWINGYFYQNTDDLKVQLDIADGVLSRIDRVVLRLDFLNREIKAVVKKGAFASSPVARILQRDADAYEIALADVRVNKGVIKITNTDITDLRLNKELCGIVHGTIDQVDSTAIFSQYQTWFGEKSIEFEAEFKVFLDSLKDLLSGDVAGNLLNKIVTVESNLGDLANLKTTNKTNSVAAINEIKDEVTSQKADLTYQVAGGTATAITLDLPTLVNGYAKTFIVKTNNGGSATTINSKSLYKPNTTTAPKLVAGKAVTVWYNSTSDCFFIKASAEGNATADKVLAGSDFSNDYDTGVPGTMPNKVGSATTITPGTVDQAISKGYYGGALGDGKVKGDANLIASNILKGKSIFGVIGNAKPFLDSKRISSTLSISPSNNILEICDTYLWGLYKTNNGSFNKHNLNGTLISTISLIDGNIPKGVDEFLNEFLAFNGGNLRVYNSSATLLRQIAYALNNNADIIYSTIDSYLFVMPQGIYVGDKNGTLKTAYTGFDTYSVYAKRVSDNEFLCSSTQNTNKLVNTNGTITDLLKISPILLI